MAQLRRAIDFDLLKQAKGRAVCDFVHGVGRGLLDDALRECGWHVRTIRGNPDRCSMAFCLILRIRFATSRCKTRCAKTAPTSAWRTIPTPTASVLSIRLELTFRRTRFCAFCMFIFWNIAKDWPRRANGCDDSSSGCDCAKHGQEAPLETPVGFKWVGEAIDKGEVIFGGEESGGLSIENHAPNKDGVVADLLLAEVWAVHREPLV
jgi:hypothetical protein